LPQTLSLGSGFKQDGAKITPLLTILTTPNEEYEERTLAYFEGLNPPVPIRKRLDEQAFDWDTN
jgi:hypothetical protein